MSAVVGVWKRTNGTLTDVLMIPDASGVLGVVDCWATAKVAININTNNNPVFFMLPPTPTAPGLSQLSLSEDKGYSRKVNKRRGKGQGYEGVYPACSQSVSWLPSATLRLHLRRRPCNIAPSLKTNGLGFLFHSRIPFFAHAPSQGLPGAKRRHG